MLCLPLFPLLLRILKVVYFTWGHFYSCSIELSKHALKAFLVPGALTGISLVPAGSNRTHTPGCGIEIKLQLELVFCCYFGGFCLTYRKKVLDFGADDSWIKEYRVRALYYLPNPTSSISQRQWTLVFFFVLSSVAFKFLYFSFTLKQTLPLLWHYCKIFSLFSPPFLSVFLVNSADPWDFSLRFVPCKISMVLLVWLCFSRYMLISFYPKISNIWRLFAREFPDNFAFGIWKITPLYIQ